MIRQKVSRRMRGWPLAAAAASLLIGGCATDVTLEQPVDGADAGGDGLADVLPLERPHAAAVDPARL